MSRRRVNLTKDAVIKFFIEEKKILTEDEYTAHPDKPVAGAAIKALFRRYDNLMLALKEHSLWPTLQAAVVKPAKVAKPKAEVIPKAATKAKITTKRPFVKPSVVKEEDSE